ncbi:replication-relaxation family protein [Psychrosphaera algicola]|uniref:Replication-relaxation family protein n=1 Tax=Psychrosphaera algicola TaxID=3023714 RepID=A0ABT5FJY4_9GAMM|nr:replication-relaxation family protein [Psychrosphaera sp. G1-22]MDC2891503.1 replication-relaxation family protein [Psychrosphaera sp. G1-22]
MYSLGRFGWLTHHQVTNLLFPSAKSSSDSIRKVLKRLTSEGYTYENSILRSPISQCKSYSLTRKGLNRIAEIDGLRIAIRNNSVTRQQMDSKYEYHRLVANQTLIDLRHNRKNLLFTLDLFISEHEIGTMRKDFAAHFGCVPDGLGITGDTLVMIEVENSVRGPLRHGSKLTHWLESYADRVNQEKKFSGHFLPLGIAGQYDDVIQLFVCTNHKNFRSIWRKVENVMRQHRIYSHIFYLVADRQYWVNPLKQAIFLEHNEQ